MSAPYPPNGPRVRVEGADILVDPTGDESEVERLASEGPRRRWLLELRTHELGVPWWMVERAREFVGKWVGAEEHEDTSVRDTEEG